jgi:hypothetical protein
VVGELGRPCCLRDEHDVQVRVRRVSTSDARPKKAEEEQPKRPYGDDAAYSGAAARPVAERVRVGLSLE